MRMAIVGKNPRAGGSECIIFGYFRDRNSHFSPLLDPRAASAAKNELSYSSDWEMREMRPGAGLAQVPALVAAGVGGQAVRVAPRVVLVAHGWSGTLEVDSDGRKYTVDLYSEETRLVLLDADHEILVDITSLATTENDTLKIPDLGAEAILRHILDYSAWFRFLESDAETRPPLLHGVLQLFRPRPAETLRRRLVYALLPVVTQRPAPAAAAPPPPAPLPSFAQSDEAVRLRDEMRLVAAAVEGLALRAAAEA